MRRLGGAGTAELGRWAGLRRWPLNSRTGLIIERTIQPLSTITRGWNIGQRLIDEYLARSKTAACNDFREVAERIARQGFRMFLNANASVTGWSQDGKSCRIVLEENPLNDFVELPEQLKGLHYSNILCGVIRGALEMVGGDGPLVVRVNLTPMRTK